MKYIFDGSYFGLLTCVFEAFEFKHSNVHIQNEKSDVVDFFSEYRKVITNEDKASRILKGLKSKLKRDDVTNFYRAYLSEESSTLQVVFNLLVRGFSSSFEILQDFGDRDVMSLSKALRQIGREQHRMKAFIRFQYSNEGLYFAMIDPDFNVLPLIWSFFKNRFSDQPWLIYDVKRNYGLMYDLKSVFEVNLMDKDKSSLSKNMETIVIDEQELKYQKLWQQYFKSTNIEARKNTKLHIQHVPKRYWKYLIEKH